MSSRWSRRALIRYDQRDRRPHVTGSLDTYTRTEGAPREPEWGDLLETPNMALQP